MGKARGLLAAVLAYLQRSCSLLSLGLRRLGRYFSRPFSGQKRLNAAHFFAALLSWGRRSCSARLAVKTLREYRLLLGQRFPAVRQEIEVVVHCYHEEVYGGARLDGAQRHRLQRAWRRLLSPRHWSLRLYQRVLGHNDWREYRGN